MELKNAWINEDSSLAKINLANLLSQFGVQRKKHYCSEIQGRSAQNLMENIDELYEKFSFEICSMGFQLCIQYLKLEC